MADKTSKLPVDEIAELLAPFIDISMCDGASLTSLRRNYKKVLSKLNETGRPVLMTIDGQTLLLSNANIYFELETKRRCLLSRFKTAEDAIQLGKVDLKDPRISELEGLQYRIGLLETEIPDLTWRLEVAKKELADARAIATALIAELKKSTPST